MHQIGELLLDEVFQLVVRTIDLLLEQAPVLREQAFDNLAVDLHRQPI